jgi:UPF0489 domain
MIDVVIVESHHHALEPIHNALRTQRLLQYKEWSMLHFDSHADLACPGQHISAIACYRPQMLIRPNCKSTNHREVVNNELNEKCIGASTEDDDDCDQNSDIPKCLYELLDSTSSGIAEWILPLVLAGNLHTIRWIRPPNTIPLIPTGSHRYNVGVQIQQQQLLEMDDTIPPSAKNNITSFVDLPLNANVKVDWDCQYYLEDDSYVPTTELHLIQPLLLTVVDGPSSISTTNTNSGTIDDPNLLFQFSKKAHDNVEKNKIYAIDICLDYFYCCNPFLHDIEVLNKPFATAICHAVLYSKIYYTTSNYGNSFDESTQSTTTNIGPDNYQKHVFMFRHLLTKLLRSFGNISPQLQVDIPVSEIINSLIPYYKNREITETYVKGLQSSLCAIDITQGRTNLIDMAIEALPYLTMPHMSLMNENDERHETIQERICFMRHEIVEYKKNINKTGTSTTSNDPYIITIARSADDGFTPHCIADKLQDMVLYELHSIFCGCDYDRVQMSKQASSPYKKNQSNPHQLSGQVLDCRLNVTSDY